MRLVEGGSFGDIYGKAFERDENGRVAFTTDKDGDKIPNVIGGGNTEKVGNCNPDFMLGWSNTFTYKGFSLYFLIDGSFWWRCTFTDSGRTRPKRCQPEQR